LIRVTNQSRRLVTTVALVDGLILIR